MNVLEKVRKVPGGLMLVPMLIMAVINTFFPAALRIGGPLSGIFSPVGAMTSIGMMLFIAGSQVRYSQLTAALTRGGLLVIVRLAIGFAASALVLRTFGRDGFMGVSALALVIALSSCNPGVYMGLMQDYGDNIDKAAVGILNIIAVPTVPLLILNVTGGGGFDINIVLSTLTPFLVGMIVSNLDPKIQSMFAPGSVLILVFIGTTLGSGVNLRSLLGTGIADLILAAIVLCVSIPLMLLADKAILRRPGYAAVAISCIGGVSVSAPGIIAKELPQYQPYADAATGQIMVSLIICIITVPYICKFVAEKFGSGAMPSDSGSSTPKGNKS
jgi:2-keto-3-deoxygluconate permease